MNSDPLRGMMLAILTLSLLGIGTELLLLGHTEGVWQKVAVGLVALCLVVLGFSYFSRNRTSLQIFRVAMILLFVGGLVGMYFHIRGNIEFELEMEPTLSGWPLIRETMTGATPALAPGAFIPLGLLGLAYTFRHPILLNIQQHQET